MKARTAEYARPNFSILHLSDTHLVAEGRLYGDVDSAERLRQILGDVQASKVRPDVLVFSGDLTDRGEAAAYDDLRALVDPLAAELDATVVWAMGNHDDRAQLRVHLLDQEPSSDAVDAVHDIDGLRVISLDTTVPGRHHGELTDEQLAWLSDVLATRSPHGCIVVMHHPPMPAVMDLSTLVELVDQQKLADVLRGSDVRQILSGHLHYSTTATFAGIPVSVASATSYTQDLAVAAGAVRGRDGAQAHNLVYVYDETVVCSVVPLRGHPTVGEGVDAGEAARRLEAHGVTIRDSSRASSRSV